MNQMNSHSGSAMIIALWTSYIIVLFTKLVARNRILGYRVGGVV